MDVYLDKNDEIEDHGEVEEGGHTHVRWSSVRRCVGEEGPELQTGGLVDSKHCVHCGGGRREERVRGETREMGRDREHSYKTLIVEGQHSLLLIHYLTLFINDCLRTVYLMVSACCIQLIQKLSTARENFHQTSPEMGKFPPNKSRDGRISRNSYR